jgi:hypothetical protein
MYQSILVPLNIAPNIHLGLVSSNISLASTLMVNLAFTQASRLDPLSWNKCLDLCALGEKGYDT